MPRPTKIVWLRNQTFLEPKLNNRIEILQLNVTGFRQTSYEGLLSNLIVKNATDHDNGMYTCRSSNGVGRPVILYESLLLTVTNGTNHFVQYNNVIDPFLK